MAGDQVEPLVEWQTKAGEARGEEGRTGDRTGDWGVEMHGSILLAEGAAQEPVLRRAENLGGTHSQSMPRVGESYGQPRHGQPRLIEAHPMPQVGRAAPEQSLHAVCHGGGLFGNALAAPPSLVGATDGKVAVRAATLRAGLFGNALDPPANCSSLDEPAGDWQTAATLRAGLFGNALDPPAHCSSLDEPAEDWQTAATLRAGLFGNALDPPANCSSLDEPAEDRYTAAAYQAGLFGNALAAPPNLDGAGGARAPLKTLEVRTLAWNGSETWGQSLDMGLGRADGSRQHVFVGAADSGGGLFGNPLPPPANLAAAAASAPSAQRSVGLKAA